MPTSCRPSSQLEEPSSDTKSAWITAGQMESPQGRLPNSSPTSVWIAAHRLTGGPCWRRQAARLAAVLSSSSSSCCPTRRAVSSSGCPCKGTAGSSTGGGRCRLPKRADVMCRRAAAPDMVRMIADSGSRSSVKGCPVAQPTSTTVGSTKIAICGAAALDGSNAGHEARTSGWPCYGVQQRSSRGSGFPVTRSARQTGARQLQQRSAAQQHTDHSARCEVRRRLAPVAAQPQQRNAAGL